MPKPFCVIPARSGSTRLKDKNLARVGGTSLLERAVLTGLEAFGEVFVSTDDEAYADLARRAGATVPGLRPTELAGEHAAVEDALRHALREWAADPEIVVLLQATSPFTSAADCRAVVDALRSHPDAGCALTAVRVPATTAFVLRERNDGSCAFLLPDLAHARSQDIPALWQISGGAYAASALRIAAGGVLVSEPVVPVEVPPERGIDIDDEADLLRAQEAS